MDLARSPIYRKGHISGAWFASGPELARDLKMISRSGPIVLALPDGTVATANVADARQRVSLEFVYLAGGTAAWLGSRRLLKSDPHWLSSPIDVYELPEKSNLATLALMNQLSKHNAHRISSLWRSNERKGDGVFRSSSGSTAASSGKLAFTRTFPEAHPSLIRDVIDGYERVEIHVALFSRLISLREQSITAVT